MKNRSKGSANKTISIPDLDNRWIEDLIETKCEIEFSEEDIQMLTTYLLSEQTFLPEDAMKLLNDNLFDLI